MKIKKYIGRAGWPLFLFAVFMMVMGVSLFAGGAALAALGGSFYYLLAGAALLASGRFLATGNRLGVWLCTAAFIFTVSWAFWEAGLDGWALLPRIFAPALLLLGVMLALPKVFPRAGKHYRN